MGDFSIPHGTFPPGYAATFGASGASPTAMNIHTAELGLLSSQMTRLEALLQSNLERATIAATPGQYGSSQQLAELRQCILAMNERMDIMRAEMDALRKKNSAE